MTKTRVAPGPSISWLQYLLLKQWIKAADKSVENFLARLAKETNTPAMDRTTFLSQMGQDFFLEKLKTIEIPKSFAEQVELDARLERWLIKNPIQFDQVGARLGRRLLRKFRDGAGLLLALDQGIKEGGRESSMISMRADLKTLPLLDVVEYLLRSYFPTFAPSFTARPQVRATILTRDMWLAGRAKESGFLDGMGQWVEALWNDAAHRPLCALLLTTLPLACHATSATTRTKPQLVKLVDKALRECKIDTNRAWLLQVLRTHVADHKCFVTTTTLWAWWRHIKARYKKPASELSSPGLLAFETVVLAQLLGFAVRHGGEEVPQDLIREMRHWTALPPECNGRRAAQLWALVAERFSRPEDALFCMAESDAVYGVTWEGQTDAERNAGLQLWITVLARAMVEGVRFDANTCHDVFADIANRSAEIGWERVARVARTSMDAWEEYRTIHVRRIASMDSASSSF